MTARPGTPERAAERRRENLDMLIGFMGFFAAVLFVFTVRAELKGESALAQALALGVMVLLIAATWRLRRRVARKPGA